MEFPCGRLRTIFVWRPFGSLLGFAIPRDSFSRIPPCFPPLGFTLVVRSLGTPFSPVGGLLFFYFLGELHIPGFPLPPTDLVNVYLMHHSQDGHTHPQKTRSTTKHT